MRGQGSGGPARSRAGRALPILTLASLACAAFVTACSESGTARPEPGRLDEVLFRAPPREHRPHVRWWWPGGAVDVPLLREELALLDGAGIGGVEIQPMVIGLSPDEVRQDPAVRSVGEPAHLEAVRAVVEEARRRGLHVDLTFGSGWSSGGPFVRDAPERQLLRGELDLEGPARFEGPPPRPSEPGWVALANLLIPGAVGPFDEAGLELVAVVGAELIDAEAHPPLLGRLVDLGASVEGGALSWNVPPGRWRVIAVHGNRTRHAVLGGAYPGAATDALILDHLDPAGVAELIEGVGEPWLAALGDAAPDGFFVDSFELVGELPWTPAFGRDFRARTGYALEPWLPLVFRAGGESKYASILDPVSEPAYALAAGAADDAADDTAERIREDYEQVRAERFLESFVAPLAAWTESRDVDLKLQAHGGWGDVLDGYALAAVPESEGLFAGGSFDFLKLAASAAHVAGREVASSESFVGLTRDPFALSAEDFHLLATRAVSAGIQRPVYHGFPHGHRREDGSPYYPFPGGFGIVAAGPLPFSSWYGEAHPAWEELIGLNRALARTAYATTRGTHRAELAWLLAERELPDRTALLYGGPQPHRFESETSRALTELGFVYDRVSRAALTGSAAAGGELEVGRATYEALLLSELHAAEPALLEAVERATAAGVPVLLLGEPPRRAPGYADAGRRDAAVRSVAARLGPRLVRVPAPDEVGQALRAAGVRPRLGPAAGEPFAFTVDGRRLDGGAVHLVANEANEPHRHRLELRAPARVLRRLDPFTGEATTVPLEGSTSFELELPARRWTVLHASDS